MTIRRGIHNTTTGRNVDSPISWAYADAAARLAATGFVAIDVGRFAWQQDDNSIWMLLTVAPTWVEITQSAIATNYLKLDASNDPITGQLALNIATGTSPFAITSTTVNTNLNADLLDGLHDTAFPILAPGASTRNVIQPSGNYKALIVKNNAAQAENPFEMQNSSGTALISASASGQLVLVGFPASTTGKIGLSFTDVVMSSSINAAVSCQLFTEPTVDTNTQGYTHYISFAARGSKNYTGGLGGITASAYNQCSGAAVLSLLQGMYFIGGNASNTSTISALYGAAVRIYSPGTGAVGTAAGLYIWSPTHGGTTNAGYGILIAAQTGAVANYAIYTNAGLVHLGDKLEFTQTDGNEYIDSLADGYLDIGATTQIRLLADTYIGAKNIVTDTTTGIKICTATNQKLGFFNATPVVQQAEITDELTTITHTAPGSPDYAIQDLIDSSAGANFGFATKDEGNSVLAVIANLQARVNELETALVTYGLLADTD